MAYGILKCDTVTFTDAGIDKSVTLSGLVQNPTFSGNVTVTGTFSGVTVTGTTANFTSGNFTNISGGTHTITSGVFAAGSAASPSITFTGDLNTGIYSPGADQVAVATNGTGRLFVDASGSVSIGDTWANNANPVVFITKNSDVGSIILKGNGGTSNALAVYNGGWSGSNQVFSVRGDGSVWGRTDLVLGTGSSFTERARIDSSGRLGIGTSSPVSTLTVNGIGAFGADSGSADVSAARELYIRGASNSSLISFQTSSTGSNGFLVGQIADQARIQTVDAHPLTFHTSNVERARIDSSGRLLVGTATAPTVSPASTALLVVRGNTSATSEGGILALANGSTAAAGFPPHKLGQILFTDSTGGEFGNIKCEFDGDAGLNDYPGRLTFSTTADGASSPTERLRISQNGVVTIQNGAVAVIDTLTDGATITPDFAAGCNFTVTLGGNRTLANPTNLTAGQSGSIFVVQDATGSRTLAFGSNWDFTGGTAPTLSTAANAVDRIDYVVRSGTSIHTVFTVNYS